MGNTLELEIEMLPDGADHFGIKVCCSPDGREQTAIFYDGADKKLKVDTTRSSLGEGVKIVESGPFELKPGEPLKLQVFVDKSIVEVFANHRQAVTRHIYPTLKDSRNILLFNHNGTVKVSYIKAWDMAASNPY
jgi:beta-fructofuranosidase